ncbi:hypothetical protein V8G54_022707 [Vigna mungo]|uniref:Uncharacterized protein n=1 Tax=Vigna mungo TaxID=3915 RepID=A0AAQ3N3A0_VIGMU
MLDCFPAPTPMAHSSRLQHVGQPPDDDAASSYRRLIGRLNFVCKTFMVLKLGDCGWKDDSHMVQPAFLTVFYIPLQVSSRGGEDFKFGGALLINDVEKDGINGDVAVDVDLEVVVPPHDPGYASDVDTSIENHLATRDVLEETLGVVRELEPMETGGKAEELAGAGWLGASLDLSRAEEGTLVEDGHGGGGVVDGSNVGVGDVDGEKNLCVQERFMDMRWKVGSFGLAEIRAVAATADAAPIIAELQLHFTFLPIAICMRFSSGLGVSVSDG